MYSFSDGIPFICGGYDGGTYYDTCYGYMPMSDSWEEIGTMPSPKYWSAYAFLEGFGLVMAGGSVDGFPRRSVFVTKDGSTFETLHALPYASRDGCLTVVDQTTLMLSGGGGENPSGALSYHITTDTWTRY